MSKLRVQALDATWETIGTGRYRGYTVEAVQATSNLWGPDTLTATLKAPDLSAARPDLAPFTPIEFEEAGQTVWSGRIIETPTSDALSIQAQGWQYHLDDDAYQQQYAHTRLSDWQDVRNLITCDLSVYQTTYSIDTSGRILMSATAGATIAAGTRAGVYLDMGPEARAQRIVVLYRGGGSGVFDFLVYSGDAPGTNLTLTTFDGAPISTTLNTVVATLSPCRYIELILDYTGGGGAAGSTDWLQFDAIQVYSDTAYESGSASILNAAMVVKDARRKAPLLNSSNTLIVDGTDFSIPHLAESSYRTPREWMQAANAYEDDILKLGGLDLRSIVMKDKPTSAGYEIGSWSGSQFQDGGASGDSIYNRVVVEGTGPDGTPLGVVRSSSDVTGSVLSVSPIHNADNPSFATNTATWTATTSTVTRDTGTFDTTPASGRWDNTGASDAISSGDKIEETFTGTFQAGVTYTVRFRIRATVIGTYLFTTGLAYNFGDIAAGNYATTPSGAFPNGVWTTITVPWVPSATTTTCKLLILDTGGGSQTYFHLDSVDVLVNKTTIVDRRNFFRTTMLPISAPLTSAVGTRLGDLWLAAHRTPTFRGTVSAAPGGIRKIIGGAEVHPSTLLRECGELMRFSHRINPDDGSLGRDGRMVAVSYDAQTETASIQIDNSRRDFETLLERFGGVVGNVLQ